MNEVLLQRKLSNVSCQHVRNTLGDSETEQCPLKSVKIVDVCPPKKKNSLLVKISACGFKIEGKGQNVVVSTRSINTCYQLEDDGTKCDRSTVFV